MKFFVNNFGMSSPATLGRAFWNTWKPQYLRSEDEVEENKDSAHIGQLLYFILCNERYEPSTTTRKNSWKGAVVESADFELDSN